MTIQYKEYRCSACKKLLFKGLLIESEIEIKCKACHTVNTLKASQFNELMCAIAKCPHRIVVEAAKSSS